MTREVKFTRGDDRINQLAIGGTARMIVSFAEGHETTLDLGKLA